LNANLPGGKLHCFGLFDGTKQIGFACFANYVPMRKGKTPIFHVNRVVIHPDYQGFGIGVKVMNETTAYMKENFPYRIMAKFSSVPLYKSLSNDPKWKLVKVVRTMGKAKVGKIERAKNTDSLRQGGIRCWSWEYQKIGQDGHTKKGNA